VPFKPPGEDLLKPYLCISARRGGGSSQFFI
jgi:hypothetical protein